MVRRCCGCAPLLVLVTCFASLGGFVFGYDVALITGALCELKRALSLARTEVELVVGGCKVGAMIGALAGTVLLPRLGHRVCLVLSASAFVAGPLWMAVCPNWKILALARLVAGLGIGLSAVVSPVYLGEVAPAALRGRVVALYELLIAAGAKPPPVHIISGYHLYCSDGSVRP